MGITKLADLIRIAAPDAISYKDISDYTGKVIALDTSIIMNQFRTAVPKLNFLSPMTGIFFRTLTFLEHDIKPVFVFDGKPPGEKLAVLERRAETAGWGSPNRSGAASSQTKECLQLLKLLGVPILQAPGDGEALCARLVSEGTADAVASEDMDTLPFGAGLLIRQLNAKKDSEVIEYSLPKILEKLKLSQEEYQEARKLFLEGARTVAQELVWTEPDEEGLVQLLCTTHHVKEPRIRGRMVKFREAREKKRKEREERKSGPSRQMRMEDFFRVTRKRKQQMDGAEAVPSKASKKT
ncbi:probable flap endonuclease 1 homolog isoform X4 [Gadus chalcogrammus]|uniref:probable flap endonuclease 1 homolog isoform X4 n=1 Tax=Gadus chalcogrammus TaxID=1042646 RepID=UPI0024C48A69|nr:probable flap endonuclease 1 homolog isoform X4 [Gadus chalcogrammus]